MTAPWAASLHAHRQRRAEAAEQAQQPYMAPPYKDEPFMSVTYDGKVAWHCPSCEVDWISVTRACWICDGQGQPGRLGIAAVLPK